MEAKFRPYTAADRSDCIAAFNSNIPGYFAEKELADFEFFLNGIEKEGNQTPFYTVIYDDKIIGCGGFGDKDNNKIISLAWGLIHKDYHKKGFGKQLLLYRFEQILKMYPGYPVVLDTTQYCAGFFEKYGFRTIKITEDFYAVGMHRYDMELTA
jgi:predicted GNAT family N-acyltransferase